MNTTENKRKHTHSNKKTWNSKILAKLQKTRAQQNKKNKSEHRKPCKSGSKYTNRLAHKRVHAHRPINSSWPCVRVHVPGCDACPDGERDPRVCIHHCVCDSSKENFNVLDQVYGIRVRTCLCMMKKKKNGKGYSQVREGNQKKSKKWPAKWRLLPVGTVGLESGHWIRFRWMDSKRGSRSENEKTKNNSDSNEIERSRLDYWMRER